MVIVGSQMVVPVSSPFLSPPLPSPPFPPAVFVVWVWQVQSMQRDAPDTAGLPSQWFGSETGRQSSPRRPQSK